MSDYPNPIYQTMTVLGTAEVTALTIGTADVAPMLDFVIASGPFLNSGTIVNGGTLTQQGTYGTLTLSGTTGTIIPGTTSAALVKLPSGSMEIFINSGFPNQHFRTDLEQPSSGTCNVTFDPTHVIFGTDVTTFVASALSGTIDMVEFITGDGTHWRVDDVKHGFSF